MPDNPGQANSAGTQRPDAAAAGERLRGAREAAGISITEITSRIHLTREAVLALESGNFAAIGPPVFVRGHLRSYARLLKLPEQEILAACPDAEPEPEVFRTQSALKQYKPGFSIVNAALLAGLVLLLVIALVYWLAGGDSDVPEAPETGAGPAELTVPYVPANGNNSGLFGQSDSVIKQQA